MRDGVLVGILVLIALTIVSSVMGELIGAFKPDNAIGATANAVISMSGILVVGMSIIAGLLTGLVSMVNSLLNAELKHVDDKAARDRQRVINQRVGK